MDRSSRDTVNYGRLESETVSGFIDPALRDSFVTLSRLNINAFTGREMPFPLQLPRYDGQEAQDSDDDDEAENEDPMGLAEKEAGWQAPRIGSMRYSVIFENVVREDFLILRAPEADAHTFRVGAVDTPLWLCQVQLKSETVSGFIYIYIYI
jgi:hypothetical protein